jgi:hypothetical protein
MSNWNKVNSYVIEGLKDKQLTPFHLVWVSNDTFDISYGINGVLRTNRFSVSKPNPIAVSESYGTSVTDNSSPLATTYTVQPRSVLSLGANNLFMSEWIVFVQNRQTGAPISTVFYQDQLKPYYEYRYSAIGFSGDSQLFCVETQNGMNVITFNVYVAQGGSVNKFEFSAFHISNIHRAIPSLKARVNRTAHFAASLTSISLHPRIPNLAAVTIDVTLHRGKNFYEKRGVAAIINLETKESQFLGWDVKSVAFSSTGRYLITCQAERTTSFSLNDLGEVVSKKYWLNRPVLALTPDPNTDDIFGICDGDVAVLIPQEAGCRYLLAYEELSAASTDAGRDDVTPASDPDAATAEATETGMTTQSIAFSTGGDYFAVVMKALGTKESIHIDVFKRCSQRVKEREVYKRGNYYYFYG